MTLKQRPHTDCFSCVTLKQPFFWFLECVPPRRMELANFWVEKMSTFPRKNWVPEWCKLKKIMYMYSVQPPIKKIKIIGHRHTNCVLRKRASCALRPPLPSSWVHSPTGPRLWTFTWSTPASGPKFPAPLNPMHPLSLYAPPHFPRNQPVLATYSGQYFLSLLLLPPPAAPPSLGRITW